MGLELLAVAVQAVVVVGRQVAVAQLMLEV
jgi:hypothetical protein